MGQKVSPISLREFINKITDSRWIAGKKDYAALLAEDVKIRKFVEKKLKKAGLAKVVIDQFFDIVTQSFDICTVFTNNHTRT